MRHPGVEIYDCVEIQLLAAAWVDVVDGVNLYQLARCSDMRAPWVVLAYSWLPGTVEAVPAPQNAAHTAETDLDGFFVYQVVPDNFGTALERCSKLKDTSDEVLVNCSWTYVWAR